MSQTDDNNQDKVYIRRCHVCGSVNEQAHETVKKCSSCGKALAPFMFFDEKIETDPSQWLDKTQRIDIDNDRLKSGTLYQHLKSQYPPLWGIAVYW